MNYIYLRAQVTIQLQNPKNIDYLKMLRFDFFDTLHRNSLYA